MNEVRIQKVENGYIVICYGDIDETYVYNTFAAVMEFVAGVMKEVIK